MVFGAELCEVADVGGAAVLPGGEVVCFVVGGLVGAAGEGALGIAKPDPVFDGPGKPVVFAADFQGCTVPRVDEDPVERLRPTGDESAGHRCRNRAETIQHCWFVSEAEEGEHGHGDQDVRLWRGDVSVPGNVPGAEE